MIGAVTAALLLAAAAPSSTPASGCIREVGGSYSVPVGRVVGCIDVTGGEVTVDGTVTGDVRLAGGRATVNGTVDGSVSVVGGSVTLGPHARIGGDIRVVGGSVREVKGASVRGTITSFGGNPEFTGLPSLPRWPGVGWHWYWMPPWNLAANLGVGLLLTLCVAALAFGVYLFFPSQVATVSNAIWVRPLASLGLGALTAVTGALLAAALAVTVILIPVTIAIGVAMAAGWILGWAGVLLLIAKRLVDTLRVGIPPTPAFAAVAVLAVVAANVPVLGGLAVLVGGAIALGGTVLTRFGTRALSGAGPPSF